MLEYISKDKFNEYVIGLEKAMVEGNWQKYMESHDDPEVHFKSSYTHDYCSKRLSSPYYSEISVDLVSSCNTSSARKKIPSNFKRVINSIPYILKNECIPIEVIKHGDEFYIKNGKHRFYAHILLKRKVIPVSIREIISEDESRITNSMITIHRPYYDNGGMGIAYPEKAIDFLHKYEDLFESTLSVEMITSEDSKKSLLKFTLQGGDVIEFLGCCTAGNRFRSSKATCDILNKCGYQVDLKYIENNLTFKLENKRDAHNISFDTEIKIDTIKEKILPNTDLRKSWDYSEEVQEDIFKLHSYLSNYKPFDTSVTLFSSNSSSFLKLDDKKFYLVGSENRRSIDSIYIFFDSSLPFNNLTVEFLGVIHSDDEIYKKLIE